MTIGDGIAAFGAAIAFSVAIWSIVGMPYWVMKHRNDRETEVILKGIEYGFNGEAEWSTNDPRK